MTPNRSASHEGVLAQGAGERRRVAGRDGADAVGGFTGDRPVAGDRVQVEHRRQCVEMIPATRSHSMGVRTACPTSNPPSHNG